MIAEGVLLPYQQRLIETVAASAVTVVEKSRRIGATWGIAALAVLTAGAARDQHGMDTLYIGYNLEMAREFVDACALWARRLGAAAGETGEALFADQPDRSIAAFRIRFASGFEILALASRPRSLRGRQGFVIIDEAAFHDDLPALLKAALALLIWGGKVLVVSTHDGAENPFAELVTDCRAGRRPYALLRITFADALADGLYRRICLVRGETWTAAGEAAWAARIRALYGEGAAEELDVIPRAGSARFLPLHLIEARADRAIPVLRWACDDGFVHLPEGDRERAATAWCQDALLPLIRGLDPDLRKALGGDIARSGDLTVFWPVVVGADLVRRCPFTVELRNVPFEQQKQILWWLLDRLTRLTFVALDATGLGAMLAELTMQRYGAWRVEPVTLSEAWYRAHMPKLKAAFEDGGLTIPADAATVEDFRALAVVRGVPRLPERRQAGRGEDGAGARGQRHGDAAIAAALAIYAAIREAAGAEAEAVPRAGVRPGLADFLGPRARGPAGPPVGPPVGADYIGGEW